MNHTVVAAGICHPGQVANETGRPLGSLVPTLTRLILRTLCFLFFSTVALLQISVMLPFIGPKARARWLHRWSRFACRIVDLRLTTKGLVPPAGLLVCNHLSYLDIIALSSLRPCVFVAKREVRNWPLFGWLASAAGTIFVQRQRRAAAAREVQRIDAAIRSGSLVVLFPEGTSSDGTAVLPFKSSLLQAALSPPAPIAAAGIDYRLAGGSVADEVCYWRDMTLVPHLMNLLGKSKIECTIRFSPSRPRGADRKALARELRTEVAALRV
jgi:lyso-ornithine lipid O-acyltransferase